MTLRIFLLVLLPLGSFSQSEDTTIYELVEVDAHFPGGAAEMQRYIIDNIEYPDTVYDMLSSKIYFSFIVEKDGSLSNIEIIKPKNPNYHSHYLELIQKMPPWVPAQLNGKKVRSRCRLPIIICFD
ncbi:MAG: energy transducer TonB [bacterium]|nr:energy transducer TonB [bacterium]